VDGKVSKRQKGNLFDKKNIRQTGFFFNLFFDKAKGIVLFTSKFPCIRYILNGKYNKWPIEITQYDE
jgi:hypothetical protein